MNGCVHQKNGEKEVNYFIASTRIATSKGNCLTGVRQARVYVMSLEFKISLVYVTCSKFTDFIKGFRFAMGAFSVYWISN